MSEQPPNERRPDEPTTPSAEPTSWDPAEQVGDIHQVEISDDGQIESAERLTSRPSIWVGSWLDYNNGVLHGDWITADRDEADILSDIQAMLARSPAAASTGDAAEDWGIFDHDGFGPLLVGEQEELAWVSAVARGITEHGPAFAAYADVMQDIDALTGFSDDYFGRYDSVQAYVENFVSDAGYEQLLDDVLPESVRRYLRLDTDAIARDLEAGSDIHVLRAEDGGVWIFSAASSGNASRDVQPADRRPQPDRPAPEGGEHA